MSGMSVTTTDVDAGEFRYIVPARLWFSHKATVLRNAAIAARRARKRAVGDPDQEMVTLVWRQEQADPAA